MNPGICFQSAEADQKFLALINPPEGEKKGLITKNCDLLIEHIYSLVKAAISCTHLPVGTKNTAVKIFPEYFYCCIFYIHPNQFLVDSFCGFVVKFLYLEFFFKYLCILASP